MNTAKADGNVSDSAKLLPNSKEIGHYSFEYICIIMPTLDESGTTFINPPHRKYANRSNLNLHAFGDMPFIKFSIDRNLRLSGVYAITANEDVMYIGECINLSSRYNAGYGQISPRNCYVGGQSTNCRINNLIYREIIEGNEIRLWFFATPDYKRVEKELLDNPLPLWNAKK